MPFNILKSTFGQKVLLLLLLLLLFLLLLLLLLYFHLARGLTSIASKTVRNITFRKIRRSSTFFFVIESNNLDQESRIKTAEI